MSYSAVKNVINLMTLFKHAKMVVDWNKINNVELANLCKNNTINEEYNKRIKYTSNDIDTILKTSIYHIALSLQTSDAQETATVSNDLNDLVLCFCILTNSPVTDKTQQKTLPDRRVVFQKIYSEINKNLQLDCLVHHVIK